MSITDDLLGAAQHDRDRYRDALGTIQAAAALMSSERDSPLAVLTNRDGELSWSAVHTFVTDVVDLGMTPDAALADLADDPAGVQEAIARHPSVPQERPDDIPGVPDQPQGE